MLINEALQVNVSSNWSYFCVEAFNYLVPYLGDDQAVRFFNFSSFLKSYVVVF